MGKLMVLGGKGDTDRHDICCGVANMIGAPAYARLVTSLRCVSAYGKSH